ncbi:hypothetical protein, partial [Photobacterium sanctipauli]|uniref:hypothetical protein n=1 Tax=Photobacterium sanctipauli TaxID=1342794 RepID=UPI00055D7C11
MKASIKNRSFKYSAIALAVAATTTANIAVAAQAEEQYTSTDESMVVVSSRTPKAISDIPGTVWFIDAEQIE